MAEVALRLRTKAEFHGSETPVSHDGIDRNSFYLIDPSTGFLMNVKIARTALMLVIATSMANVQSVSAQITPRQWSIADGGNGHWYQVFTSLQGWQAANTQSTGMMWNGQNGYLASLTSSAENDFVASSLAMPSLILPAYGFWIGAFQDHSAPDYAEPGGGWRWTSGETFAYSNWALGEPNNTLTGRNDDWAVMYGPDKGAIANKWNDDYLLAGFIVEFNDVSVVPEPSTYAMIAVGLAALGALARRRKAAR